MNYLITLFVFVAMCKVHAMQDEPYILNVKYDTKIYLLFYKTFASNTQASKICAKQGGDLVNILGAEVQRQIFNNMKRLVSTYYFQDENVVLNETWSYWISTYSPRLNLNYEGHESKPYRHWYLEVLGFNIGTDYNGGATSYGCPQVLLGTDEGFWSVAPCNRQMPFICEIPKEDGRFETEHATYSIYIQSSIRSQSYTRDTATTICHSTGGHLAFIRNLEENKVLLNVVKDYIQSVKTPTASGISWIGVTNTSADFKQLSYDDGSNTSFTNWRNSQPEIYSWQYSYKLCVIVDEKGEWQLTFCQSTANFVCQYDKSKANLTHIEELANNTDWYDIKSTLTVTQENGTTIVNVTNIATSYSNVTNINNTIVKNNNVTSYNDTNNNNHYNVTNVNNTNNIYNMTTNNNTTNINETNTNNNFNVTNVNNSNVANANDVLNNMYNSTSINTTNVYDRKMLIGHASTKAIFWTLVAIGILLVIIICNLLCICVAHCCCRR